MKALVVAGARPNFMKVAPVLAALRAAGHEAVLVHTGQHYDAGMSDAFFADLGMAAPEHHLEVGSGSQAEQTARVMERFDPVLLAVRPDWVIVVGDVNSTLAAALVTAKRRSEIGTRLAHVEAGLRSGDWAMPEEVNRVLTDQLADLLLIHSPEATGHLAREGIPAERVVFVGNVMMDALFDVQRRAGEDRPWEGLALARAGYGLLTLHRPSNVDDAGAFGRLLEGLGEVARELPLVWPMHPRARGALDRHGLTVPAGIHTIEPVGYREMTAWLDGAELVITDSGGLQEESTALGVPCVTLRESTERPITVTEGTNRMVPWPPTVSRIRASVAAAREAGRGPGSGETGRPAGWDGRAAERIVAALLAAPRSAARSPLPAVASAVG
jgi:UDP-N-acetylglucosamine 2-epimerase (non-hydrolysing)